MKAPDKARSGRVTRRSGLLNDGLLDLIRTERADSWPIPVGRPDGVRRRGT
jgi:hypothetical protein